MKYAKDERVELVHTADQYSRLQPGDLGTVSMTDSLGTVHVKWDNGSNLGMIEEAGDRIRRAPEEGPEALKELLRF